MSRILVEGVIKHRSFSTEFRCRGQPVQDKSTKEIRTSRSEKQNGASIRDVAPCQYANSSVNSSSRFIFF